MSTPRILSKVSAEANASTSTEEVQATCAVLFASRSKDAPAGDLNRSFSTATFTSTTSKTKVDSYLMSSFNITHVATQTKGHNAKTNVLYDPLSVAPRAPQKFTLPNLVGKETKIQVEFAHFDRILLRNNEKRLNVNKAALAVTKSSQFKKSLKRYVDAVVTVNELDEDSRDPSAAKVALMELINHVVSSAPGLGLKSSYCHDLFYLKEVGPSASQMPSGSGTPNTGSHQRSNSSQ